MKALAVLQTDADRHQFLTALMSSSEIKNLRHRWHAMQLLLCGKTQREARDEAKVSIATVSRAARQIRIDGHFLRTVRSRY